MDVPADNPDDRRRFYPEVESLRGVAAFIVLIGHYKLICLPPETGPIAERLGSVKHAFSWFVDSFFQPQPSVLLFFVISGFVLGIQLQKQPVDSLKTYGAYVVRRAFRLLPAMWLVAALAYVVLAPTGYLIRPRPSLIIKTMEFRDITVDLPLWTLGVEMACSMLFPLLYWLHRRLGRRGNYVLLAMLSSIPFLGGIDGLPKLPIFAEFLPFFLAGLMIERESAWLRPLMASRLAMPATACAFLVLTLSPQLLQSAFNANRWQAWMWLEIPACSFIVAVVVEQGRNHLLDALRSGPAKRLGRISYSLYLVHYFIGIRTLFILRHWGTEVQLWWAPCFVLAGFVSLGLAAILFRFVERPFIRLGRHIAIRIHEAQTSPIAKMT